MTFQGHRHRDGSFYVTSNFRKRVLKMGDATVESLVDQMRDLSFGTSGNLKAARALMKKTPRDHRKKMAVLASEEGGYIEKAFGDVFHYNENAKRYVDRDRRKICMDNKVMMANAFGGVKSISRESGKSGKVRRSRSRSHSQGKDDDEKTRSGSRHRDRHGSSRHGSSRHGSSKHGSSKHGSSRHGSSRHGSSKRDQNRREDDEEPSRFGEHDRHRHSRSEDQRGERERNPSRHDHNHRRSRHREGRDRSRHRDRE